MCTQPRFNFAFRGYCSHRFCQPAFSLMSNTTTTTTLSDVLQFWFDGADDAHNNVVHTRWFVADKSPAQRALDELISESLRRRAGARQTGRIRPTRAGLGTECAWL
jgi:hypothetical protein